MNGADDGRGSPAAVLQLGYITLGVSDIAAWRAYATADLGLQENGEDGEVCLRMDQSHHRLRLRPSGEDDIVLHGWAVKDAAALAEVSQRVADAGLEVQAGTPQECAARKVMGLTRFRDPDGLETELFYGAQIDHTPFVSPRGLTFVADDLGLGHIVLTADDAGAYAAFYTEVLGARLSDVIEVERGGQPLKITFLHVNARHHSLAIVQRHATPSEPHPKRLRHFMLEAASLDDVGVMRARLAQRGAPTGALGRHTNDRMVSFYSETPSGFAVEFGWGGLLIDDEAAWRVQHHRATSIWGHDAPQRPVSR